MRCIPKQQRMALVNIFVALTLTLGIASFAASVIFSEAGNHTARFWTRLLAAIFIVSSIYVFARYRIMKFTYVIRPREEWDKTGLVATYASISQVPYYMLDFAAYKTVGMGEPVAQCIFSLEDFRGMTPIADLKTFKDKFISENGAGFMIYDFTMTPWSRDSILLVFKFKDKYEEFVGILIEPDEQMRTFFETIG